MILVNILKRINPVLSVCSRNFFYRKSTIRTTMEVFQIRVELKKLPNLPNISANYNQTEKRQNVWILNGHPSYPWS